MFDNQMKQRSLIVQIVIASLIMGLLAGCGAAASQPQMAANPTTADYAGKKVLWVDSYHAGYEASDGLRLGIERQLEGTGVDLKIVHMDTKRNIEAAFGEAAAVTALAEIESFDPDVVIATDDNAQKYLVVPYLKDTELPVVFAAVNWDASGYGYPTANVTGMIEVDLTVQMIEHLRRFSEGERIGFIAGDTATERKVIEIYNDRFFEGQMQAHLVSSFAEFKERFRAAQTEFDMLILANNAGISDWDAQEAERFIRANTQIPTGSHNDWMAPYVLLLLAKQPVEWGEWAGQTTLQILGGTAPADIPLAENKQGNLILNLDIAEQLDIIFPASILRNATVYAE